MSEEKGGFKVVEVEPYAQIPQEPVVEEPKPVQAEPPVQESKVEPKVETEPSGDPVRSLVEPEIDYKSEYERITKEKEAGKSNPYKNPNYYKLEVIEQETPEEASIYQRLVFGKPDDKELWKIGFLKDHPELADDPEAVERKFQRTYPNLFDSSLAPEDQEYKDAKLDLRTDAAKVKRELMKRLDSVQIPDPVVKDNQEKEVTQKLAQSWKPGFQQLQSDSKFEVKVSSEKDKLLDSTYEFEIPQPAKQKYMEEAAVRVLGNKMTYDQNAYAQIKNYVVGRYISDNFQSIASSIAEQAVSKRDQEWIAKTTNNEPLKSTGVQETRTADRGVDAVNRFIQQF